MNASDLKPCPFCGGEATLRYSLIGMDAYVKCYNCEVSTTMYKGIDRESSEQSAVAAWNRRANDEYSGNHESLA